jgi:hypothetical protein
LKNQPPDLTSEQKLERFVTALDAETVVEDDTLYLPKGAHVSHFATCPQGRDWKGKKR